MNADVYTQQLSRQTHSDVMKDILIMCLGPNMKSWKDVMTQIFWKQIRTVNFGKTQTGSEGISWKTLLDIWMEKYSGFFFLFFVFFYRIKKTFNRFLKLWLCFLFRRPIITKCWETDVEDSDSLSDGRNVLTAQRIVQIIKWVCCLCSWYSLFLQCLVLSAVSVSLLFCLKISALSPFTPSSVSFLLSPSLVFVAKIFVRMFSCHHIHLFSLSSCAFLVFSVFFIWFSFPLVRKEPQQFSCASFCSWQTSILKSGLWYRIQNISNINILIYYLRLWFTCHLNCFHPTDSSTLKYLLTFQQIHPFPLMSPHFLSQWPLIPSSPVPRCKTSYGPSSASTLSTTTLFNM